MTRKIKIILIAIFMFSIIYIGCNGTGLVDTTGTAYQLRALFIHHSVGANLIDQGNIRGLFTTYNTSAGKSFEFWDQGYRSDGLRDASGVKSSTNLANPTDDTSPNDYYNLWTSTESSWSNLRSQIVSAFGVIAFKSCFTATEALTDDATLSQYKTYYLAMRDYFDTQPTRVFIVMSPPPLHRLNSNAAATATNGRAFADWLDSSTYLSGHANLQYFNLFDSLASPTDNMLRYEYEGDHTSDDSHPNQTANEAIAPLFASQLQEALLYRSTLH